MDLHRVEGMPEWAGRAPAQMNAWQKVAARSSGIITIGNYFSLLGLLSVPVGLSLILRERYLAGVFVLALGRLCDLLDGYLADKTGTKSPLGEKIDAVFDKISTGLAVFVLAVSAVVPWWVIVLLVVPHVVVAIMAIKVFMAGKLLHPSRLGKLSMAAGWLTLLAFVTVYAFAGTAQTAVFVMAYGLLAAAVGISLAALRGYYREYGRLR